MTPSKTNPVSVRTLGVWKFEFSNYQPGDPDHEVNGVPAPIPPKVYVSITKFDPDAGMVEWKGIHKQGVALGTADDGSTAHLVFSAKKGKMVKVDFKSGGKIDRIEVDKMEPYEYKVCDPAVVGGVLVCKGPKTEKAFVRVNKVLFTDEEGMRQETQTDAGPGRQADRLCPDHGGAAPAPPPAPGVDTDKKGNKDDDAVKMLDQAEELWSSSKQSDKQKAVELYKQLLKSYGDTETVKKSRDRITERSKKKFD
jgi:hypothetical protein